MSPPPELFLSNFHTRWCPNFESCRSEQQWLNEAEIGAGIQKFIIGIRGTLSDYVGGLMTKGTFAGIVDPVFTTDVIAGGLWLADPFRNINSTTGTVTSTDEVDISAEFLKIFYSQMIKLAWNTTGNTVRIAIAILPAGTTSLKVCRHFSPFINSSSYFIHV
jgi:hypothetical protein